MPRFENPTGHWSYEGPFCVHLVRQDLAAEFDGLPGFTVKHNVITAGADPTYPGFVKQSMGAIQCRCGEREFYFGYQYLVMIVKADGTPLWVNRDYDGHPLPIAPPELVRGS
jgi:hypothetical protein